MKTLRFLTIAFSVFFITACGPKNDGKTQDDQTQSESSTPTEEAPGVGAAPDNSQSTEDSLTQQADTASLKKPQ